LNAKSENRLQLFVAFGLLAALVTVLSISAFLQEGQSVDLFSGFLLGLSIVWNMAFIIIVIRHLRKNRSQK